MLKPPYGAVITARELPLEDTAGGSSSAGESVGTTYEGVLDRVPKLPRHLRATSLRRERGAAPTHTPATPPH
jgi:hypothetical protein